MCIVFVAFSSFNQPRRRKEIKGVRSQRVMGTVHCAVRVESVYVISVSLGAVASCCGNSMRHKYRPGQALWFPGD